MAKRRSKLLASDVCQLDPLDCDSLVSYSLYRRRDGCVRGSVMLTDCSRAIQWYFEDNVESLAKINRAKTLLQNFETALRDHVKITKRRKQCQSPRTSPK